MAPRTGPLEERLARVERELEDVKATLARDTTIPWWQQIDGDFKDDAAFAEIVRLGAEIRQADGKQSS